MPRAIDPREQHARREAAARASEKVVVIDLSRAPFLTAALRALAARLGEPR